MKTSYKIVIVLVAALIVGAAIYLKRQNVDSPSDITPDIQNKSSRTQGANSVNSVVAEPEVVSVKEAKLKEELVEAMAKLPTINDIQNLDHDEVHFTPAKVNEGGAVIGQLLEAAENDPSRREETLSFFKACAENSSLVEAIRAVCWKTTLSRIPKWEIFLPVSDADVPESIKDLAGELPEL